MRVTVGDAVGPVDRIILFLDEDMLNHQNDLQEQLRAALDDESIDVSQVLSLATELAKADPDKVRFFADAGIIRRLGFELVSRQETAVSELVKNAYDADAAIVDLIFHNTESPGGSLEIRDNGLGMNRSDLVNGFMRLSSDSKIREPISPRYNRRRAGRKGIGRFAVERLGRWLTITTQTISSETALRVHIDWDQFEAGRDLSAIASHVETIPKERDEGTTLMIEGLREAWSEAQMRRVWRYIADLIQPFPLSKVDKKDERDPGFRAEIYFENGGDLVAVADEILLVYDYALADVDAGVDGNGHGWMSIRSSRYPQINDDLIPIGSEPEDPTVPFEHLSGVRLKAYYFIYNAGLIPSMLSNVIQKLARTRGGVRLYRNGFRVLPYGESQNDWLGLNGAYGKREVLVPIANSNFFGFVELVDPEGKKFEETASREGLVENDAFDDLRNFVFRVLRMAVMRVAEAREKKRIAPGRSSQIEAPPEDKVRSAIDELRKLSREPREAAGSRDRTEIDEAFDRLDKGFEALTRQRDELIDELGMLRVLATLGIVIGEFTHEIRGTLTAARGNAASLVRIIQEPEQARATAVKLERNVGQMVDYAGYFDRAVRENARRELQPQEVGRALLNFRRDIGDAAMRGGIDIRVEVADLDLYTCPMHGSELDSIIFNLYSNSVKAVRRSGRYEGHILARASRADGRIRFEFADNGDGVPESNRERIFNAFFTTSTYGGDLDEEMQGSGLGLKIVSDIVNGYRGSVSLVDPPEGYFTNFRVELPEASPDQLEKYES